MVMMILMVTTTITFHLHSFFIIKPKSTMSAHEMSSLLSSTTKRCSSQRMPPVKPAELACLPTVDFARLNHCLDLKSRSMMVQTLGKACKEMGLCNIILQVINHGISHSVMKGALETALDFFETSADEKAALASNDIRKPVRYGASPKDGISDSRCFLKKYAHPLQEWIPLWPLSPPDYRYSSSLNHLEAWESIQQT